MNTDWLPEGIKEAASAFGAGGNLEIKPIGKGLIHSTYRIKSEKKTFLLQQLNTTVFPHPEDIQENYVTLYHHLQQKGYFLPAFYQTIDGELFWRRNQKSVWRAFELIENSNSPEIVRNKEEAVAVVRSFGEFTSALRDFPALSLRTTISRFHDLNWRYQQFSEALKTTTLPLAGDLQKLVLELEQRTYLLKAFNHFGDEKGFPLHVMHHDCKISNLLFSIQSKEVICPVDLDTTMPGKFFSDLGDMIRTMCCSVDENSIEWDTLFIREDLYETVFQAYSRVVSGFFTKQEMEHLHYSGLLLLYMQALRFMTDFLNGNIYYKVTYPEQNFHRAKNQLLLLRNLEDYLQKRGLIPVY